MPSYYIMCMQFNKANHEKRCLIYQEVVGYLFGSLWWLTILSILNRMKFVVNDDIGLLGAEVFIRRYHFSIKGCSVMDNYSLNSFKCKG